MSATPLPSGLVLSGLLIASIRAAEPDRVIVSGADVERRPDGLIVVRRKNAFVDIGLQIALDRLFGLSGPPGAISHIGVSADAQAVVAGTTLLDPAGGATGKSIKAISPAASRTGNVVTAGATFTQADVNFVIAKVGLLNTSTDAGTGLIDVIGGVGASPFNQPFQIDLTGTTSFSLTMQIQVTGSAS